MTELVDGRESAKVGMITKHDVTGNDRTMTDDDLVTDLTVVGDMGMGEQGAVIADRGG